MSFVADRGRLPQPHELADAATVEAIFGSIKRAFLVIRRVTGSEQWDEIAAERKEDLELYLALAQFDRRPRWSHLPGHIQHDVRAFFGNYTAACMSADKLLLSVGRPEEIDRACVHSQVGKLTPAALYVHRSAMDQLPHILRAFEGCGRGYLGEVEGANIVKLYRTEPKISYLSYPDFEFDPHPKLAFSLNVNLRELSVRKRRYSGQPNPPVLHRKETFLAPDHALWEKFSRLTRIEEAHGLLEQTDVIGLLRGWENVLSQKRLELRGHRVVRAKIDVREN
jgi:DNA phosphorothioation-associated putative methyltransferase